MGISWWDIAKTAAPIAASFTPLGPLGGILVAGAMGAGEGVSRGEGVKGALLRGGLGAGSGALGAGIGSALTKGAASAATSAAAKGAQKAVLDKTLEGGGKLAFGAMGTPIFSGEALKAGAGKLAEGTAKSRGLAKFADLTANAALDPEKNAMLKTVSTGSKALGQVANAMQPQQRRQPTFADVGPQIQHPGFGGAYQYGGGTRSLGFGRYF